MYRVVTYERLHGANGHTDRKEILNQKRKRNAGDLINEKIQ